MLPAHETPPSDHPTVRRTWVKRVRRHAVGLVGLGVLLIATSPVVEACSGCGVGVSGKVGGGGGNSGGNGGGGGGYSGGGGGSSHGGGGSSHGGGGGGGYRGGGGGGGGGSGGGGGYYHTGRGGGGGSYPPPNPNAGKISSLGTQTVTPPGQTWVGCPKPQSAQIAWPTILGKPSVADVNAGIDYIWPEPLPNGGAGYTWGCFDGTVFTSTPPSAPGDYDISGNSSVADGNVKIASQTVSPFLVGDQIVAVLEGGAPPDVTLVGSAGRYTYAFLLRWGSLPDYPDKWDWNDGTITGGQPDGTGVHSYSNVSGSAHVPVRGVTIAATRWWQPLCSAQVVDTSQPPGSPGYFVQDDPLGTYPCDVPADVPVPLPQNFVEATPPAPHIIRQIEPVAINP